MENFLYARLKQQEKNNKNIGFDKYTQQLKHKYLHKISEYNTVKQYIKKVYVTKHCW